MRRAINIEQRLSELRSIHHKMLKAYVNEQRPHSPNDRKKWSRKVDMYEKKMKKLFSDIKVVADFVYNEPVPPMTKWRKPYCVQFIVNDEENE
jgi:hypothetical protein